MPDRTVKHILDEIEHIRHKWSVNHYPIFKISVCKTTYSVTIECYRNAIKFYESALLRIDGIDTVFTCRDIFKYAHVTGHINKTLPWD